MDKIFEGIHRKKPEERTLKEVEFLRSKGAIYGGCCNHFANMSDCNCLTRCIDAKKPTKTESYFEAAEGMVEVPFTPDTIKGHSGSKYVRKIKSCITRKVIGEIDVYSVADAYGPLPMPRNHALKKVLCAGLRDKGSAIQDLKEAIDALKEDIKQLEAEQ